MSGIYLHIPFCKQACHYCDFHFSTSIRRKDEMLTALRKELLLRKDEIRDPVQTIYFGGGTPSLLNRGEIEEFLSCIYENFQVVDGAEITLEANPDDLEPSRIEELAKTLVNRLSLGIQSFREEDLRYMNRAHDSRQALDSMKAACDHFEDISIDLIYGTPGLSREAWKENLKTAFGFPINHISSYALTVEPKTALDHFIRAGKSAAPDENEARIHFEILMQESEKKGFVHYEVSNFARKDYESRHNTSYWKGESYLGIGPSAHSYSGSTRSWNIANNAKYLKAIGSNQLDREVERLSKKDKINEMIMTSLRTSWGLSLKDFEGRFGKDSTQSLLESSERFLKEGLLAIESDRLRTTKSGFFLIDGIASDLFMD
jgi:oxygen-independent coproporphyrinogen-3 oxidase